MGTMAKWRIAVADEIALTEPHFEDGERREFKVWFCIATDDQGHRLRTSAQWEDFDKAEWLADCLQEVVDAGLEAVEDADGWIQWWPVYGSEAHSEDDLAAWERRCEEDDRW